MRKKEYKITDIQKIVYLTSPLKIIKDGNNNINNTDIKKFVILTFGDIPQSQFTEARPILDRYGFKASFFVTCNWVGEKVSDAQRMTWSELQQIYIEKVATS